MIKADRVAEGPERSEPHGGKLPTLDGKIVSEVDLPSELFSAFRDQIHFERRTRSLLALVCIQVLAMALPIVELVEDKLLGTDLSSGLFATLEGIIWINILLATGFLLLIFLSVTRLLQRPRTGGPVLWMLLGAALGAQAILAAGSVAVLAQNAGRGAANAVSLLAPAGWSSAAIRFIVFMATLGAYLALRKHPAPDTIGHEFKGSGQNGAWVMGAGLGVAATSVVLIGNLAYAFRPNSQLACVDITTDVGIAFRGALGLTVVDGSDRSVEMQQNNGNGVAVGDYNKDGNLDLYLLGQPGRENRLYHNNHSPSHEGFTDVTASAGLAGFSGSRAAQFVDLNNDGLLDLVAVNDYSPNTALQPSRIYQNLGGGRFGNVTGASGFEPVGIIVGGLGIADFNRDGLPDIYITYWTGGIGLGVSENYGSHNVLFENLGGFQFKDVTVQVGLGSLSAGSFTPIFADLNGDGWPDLYVAVDAAPEVLFLNDKGTFRDATVEAGLGATRNGMGATLFDPEGVGIPSIYVTNITEPDHKLGVPPGGNALLRSRLRPGGPVAYVDDADAAGARDAGWAWGATFTDLNLDGYYDLFVAQGMDVHTRGVSTALMNDRAHVFVGTGLGTFVRATSNGCDIPGDQRAVVAFDYNRDGAPDLLVSQVLLDFKLLENRTERVGHWLTVVVEPTAGRTVVGAKVTVIAGGRRWVQTLIGGGSYLTGPPNEAYFGLGSTDQVTSVTIDWPDGTTTSRSGVTADRLLLMQQP